MLKLLVDVVGSDPSGVEGSGVPADTLEIAVLLVLLTLPGTTDEEVLRPLPWEGGIGGPLEDVHLEVVDDWPCAGVPLPPIELLAEADGEEPREVLFDDVREVPPTVE